MTDRTQAGAARERLDPGHEILNLEEAARFLGVSVKTFNKVLHSESLPARKIGREWKFSRQALVAWVGQGSSHDYYREASREGSVKNGVLEPQPRRDAAADARPAASKTEKQTARRTSGWRLELD